MAQLKHFIITQFNIRLWSKDKQNLSTYTEEWLSKRFILFDKYCFPSIQNQTRKDFYWICLFDKGTPTQYLEKIDEYKKVCPQMIACFLDEQDTTDWLGFTKNVIKQYLGEEDKYIATTNVDNDDSIHLQMIERVHSLVNSKSYNEDILYSFNYGYQYFTSSGIILKMKYPHNHFLTLVEINRPDFSTIKSMGHAKARKHYKTIDIKDEPFWIEFVHNNNVNNDLRITSRISYTPILRTLQLDSFGLDIVLNGLDNKLNTIFKLPPLFLKTAVRRLKKKINKKKGHK